MGVLDTLALGSGSAEGLDDLIKRRLQEQQLQLLLQKFAEEQRATQSTEGFRERALTENVTQRREAAKEGAETRRFAATASAQSRADAVSAASTAKAQQRREKLSDEARQRENRFEDYTARRDYNISHPGPFKPDAPPAKPKVHPATLAWIRTTAESGRDFRTAYRDLLKYLKPSDDVEAAVRVLRLVYGRAPVKTAAEQESEEEEAAMKALGVVGMKRVR